MTDPSQRSLAQTPLPATPLPLLQSGVEKTPPHRIQSSLLLGRGAESLVPRAATSSCDAAVDAVPGEKVSAMALQGSDFCGMCSTTEIYKSCEDVCVVCLGWTSPERDGVVLGFANAKLKHCGVSVTEAASKLDKNKDSRL